VVWGVSKTTAKNRAIPRFKGCQKPNKKEGLVCPSLNIIQGKKGSPPQCGGLPVLAFKVLSLKHLIG
jgi:hypothetical protein